MTLTTTIEAGIAQGRDPVTELERVLRASEAWPVLEAAGFAAPDYANDVLRIDDRHGYLDVDRLYVDLYAGDVDLRVGRQALNWGSAQFFNPTDPFPEVLLAEPWRPRRGVNAVRVSVPFAERLDASVVAAVDDTFTVPRAAGRVRYNVFGADVAAVAVFRGPGQDAVVGLDVRGTLVVGYWLEAAFLFPDAPHEEISVGLDYSFPVLERLTIAAQYHRNGAGARDDETAGRLLGLPGASSGARNDDPFASFVRSTDYLLLATSLGILEELSTSAAILQNLNDGSGLVIPTVSWFPLDWLELAGSATVPYVVFNDGGEFRPAAEDLKLTVPSTVPGETLEADLQQLSPAATVTLWTRIHY